MAGPPDGFRWREPDCGLSGLEIIWFDIKAGF